MSCDGLGNLHPERALKHTITFRQFAAALPRWILACRSPFSAFLARSLHAQPSNLPASSAVFPIPLPRFGIFKSSGPQLPLARWWTLIRHRLIHVLVVALNYLQSGLRHVDLTELGRRPSIAHRAIFRRLGALVTASDTPGEFPLPPGRAGPKFLARLFDLESYAKTNGLARADPYMDSGQNAEAGVPSTQPIDKIPEEVTFQPSEQFSPLRPYRSLQADRLKLSGTGQWPIASFLESELWLPFCEPAILELPPRRCVGPALHREDLAENLKLAKIWDARGLLALFHEPPKHFCRVFNAHKSEVQDRQIGDRRFVNQHEMHLAGPSGDLPNGPLVCSIHCPISYTLRGSVSDRKDFYHQCEVSRSRAFSNCLPFAFDTSDFEGTKALAELLNELKEPTSREKRGDRYGMKRRNILSRADISCCYAGFKSLYQGDHLGVEYALEGHRTMLQRSGLLSEDVMMQRHSPFPAGPEWQGLVIDDFFAISRELPHTLPEDTQSAKTLRKAERTYSDANVLGSDDKTIVAAERFKVIGSEIASDPKTRGAGLITVGAPVARRISLALISLRLAWLPIITKDLASRLAGVWISCLMFRRPLTCLLHHLFALGSKDVSDARDVVKLPRKVADELALASVFSLCALTGISVPYASRIYATDASLGRGAVTSRLAEPEVVETLWLGGDRKGAYTRLDNSFGEILKHLGEEPCSHEHDLTSHQLQESPIPEEKYGRKQKPARSIDFAFDFVEICGGSGVLSKAVAKLGFCVCTPIDLSRSPFFDLTDSSLLWWIFGMIKAKRFRSVCVEPPCATFSPAQHPASRSYACPLGFDRGDKKTWLGNVLAFRCLLICWFACRHDCPSLAEQPHLSKMAWLSIWKYLIQLGFEESVIASCRFGSKHKKAFRLLGHGLDMQKLRVPCLGGHQHVRIEGKFTKQSAVYVEGLADHIASVFASALNQKRQSEAFESSAPKIESVLANDQLVTGHWEVEHTWAWRYPSHINVFESYSLVSLFKKLVTQGGDQRLVALLDSRVAKGAHGKGRSSSLALRGSLQKSCAYLIAGNLHPSYGFAPTRINNADAPTRLQELPQSSDHSIVDFLSQKQLAALHSHQVTRPTAGWIRLYILIACLGTPEATSESSSCCLGQSQWTFQCIITLFLGFCFWNFAKWICAKWTFAQWTSPFAASRLFPVRLLFVCVVGPWCGVCGHSILHCAALFVVSPVPVLAMPILPTGAEDVRRAGRRAEVQLHADRVVKQQTRNYRQSLLSKFDTWLAEAMRTTLDDLLHSGQFDAEAVAEALTAYGKELYYAGRPYGQYSETINAVTAAKPTLRRQVQAAWDLAFNWVADEPHEHHPALPLSILLALVSLASLWGWDEVAAVLMTAWAGLLRIGEVIAATRAELIPPRDSAPGSGFAFLKILQPKTRGRAARHQCARIDYPDVISFLDAVYGDSSYSRRLWSLSPQTLRKRFNQLQQALGFQASRPGGKYPYDLGSLRPGGATFILQQIEDSELVRRRGRWLSTRVLEIYLQETAVATHHQRLSEVSRTKIQTLAARFPEIMTRAIFFLETKIPPSSWPYLW